MVNVEYANAYSEVLEVLNHMSKEDYNSTEYTLHIIKQPP